MQLKEKGRLRGDPIPNCVWQDIAESKSSLANLQAHALAQCVFRSYSVVRKPIRNPVRHHLGRIHSWRAGGEQ